MSYWSTPAFKTSYAARAYNWFTEQPLSTRARQFAVGYTALDRASTGNYLGAIGAIRSWPKTYRPRTYTRRRSRRYNRQTRYTKSRNYKKIRGLRTSKQYSRRTKYSAKNYRRKRSLRTIALWKANKSKRPRRRRY